MRRVNLRYPVLFACALAVGTTVGLTLVRYRIDPLWLIAALPLTAFVFILSALLRKNAGVFLPIALTLVFFLFGAIGCNLRSVRYDAVEIADGQTYAVTGTVCEKGTGDYGDYLLLKNVTANGSALYGKTRVALKEKYGDFCDVGYTVSFTAALYAYDLFAYGEPTYNAINDVKYRATVYGELQSAYGFSLFGSVRSAVKSTVTNHLSSDTAAVVCAMLLGDDAGVEDGTLQALRCGGIAHIFAVSGLHIGVLYGILYFLTKRICPIRWLSALICLGGVLFYAGVCGFTLSSVRATVMCAVSAVTKLTRKKYDGANALALSVIFILAINPLNLFSTGFLLSVCAVGGILLLSNKAAKLLRKIKIPDNVGKTAGTALGAQLGTMPVMLARFGYVSGAGLLLNLLLVPLLSLLFVLLFAGVFLSVLLPPIAAAAIPAVALPLEAILSFLVNAGLENALITGFGAGWFMPVAFILLLLLSDKLNLRRLRRVTAVVCAVAVLVCYTLVKTFFPLSGFQVVVSAKNGEAVILKSAEGIVLVVTENTDDRILATLNDHYATRVAGVILLGGEDCALIYPSLGLNCEGYVCSLYPDVQTGGGTLSYVQRFALCGIEFEFFDGYSLYAQTQGVRLGICAGKQIALEGCDLLISRYENTACPDETVYFSLRGETINAYDFGDLCFYLSDSTLTPWGFAQKN